MRDSLTIHIVASRSWSPGHGDDGQRSQEDIDLTGVRWWPREFASIAAMIRNRPLTSYDRVLG
jgi:hypothetical protein